MLRLPRISLNRQDYEMKILSFFWLIVLFANICHSGFIIYLLGEKVELENGLIFFENEAMGISSSLNYSLAVDPSFNGIVIKAEKEILFINVKVKVCPGQLQIISDELSIKNSTFEVESGILLAGSGKYINEKDNRPAVNKLAIEGSKFFWQDRFDIFAIEAYANHNEFTPKDK